MNLNEQLWTQKIFTLQRSANKKFKYLVINLDLNFFESTKKNYGLLEN